MSRLILGTPIVTAALIASLAIGSLVLPGKANAAAAVSAAGTVSVTVTVNPSIRLMLEAPTGAPHIASARECEITFGPAMELSGQESGGCYTIIQQ